MSASSNSGAGRQSSTVSTGFETTEKWQTERALEGVNEMFHFMVHSCFEKCVSPRLHHMEPNIGSGEGHCVDRCVLKYFQAQTIAGMRLKKHGLSIN